MRPELSRLQKLTYTTCMPVCSAIFANHECGNDMSQRNRPLAPFQLPNKKYFITEFSRGEPQFDSRCDPICNTIAGSTDYHHPLNVRKIKEVFKSKFPGACPPKVRILIPDLFPKTSNKNIKVDIISGASRSSLEPKLVYYPGGYFVFPRINIFFHDVVEMTHQSKKIISQTAQNCFYLIFGAALFFIGIRGPMRLNSQVAKTNLSTQA